MKSTPSQYYAIKISSRSSGLQSRIAARSQLLRGKQGVHAGGGAKRRGQDPWISEDDLQNIERDFSTGLTSVQIVDLFAQRGIRFSEATFRKYVQLGLLPRSRRVGRKGKHQGSLGVYPAKTVRRIQSVKRWMAQDLTIEAIQKRFLRFRDDIEVLQLGLKQLIEAFEEVLAKGNPPDRRQLKADLAQVRRFGDDLLLALESVERRISEPEQELANNLVPQGAEDLL